MDDPPSARLHDPAQGAARDPPGPGRDPGRRVERLLQPRLARRLAPGHLLHQPQGHRRLAEIFASRPDLSRGRSGPSPAEQRCPGLGRHPDASQGRLLFSAYSEGWALYAEQVADELGAYKDPLERAGYLQSFLFRAERLVVDTGLHSKRWTREQATDLWSRRPASRGRAAARDRALLRPGRAGLQLQDRPHRLEPGAGRSPEGARQPLRHSATSTTF